MKNLIAILLLAAFTASAQVVPVNVGSYPGDPSGEQIGHQLLVKLNYDLAYLEGCVTNLQAQLAALQAAGQSTNAVLSSTTVSLLNSNPFVFNGTSNYLGQFTNVFSVVSMVGTNALTNMMSVDAGATWQTYAATNPITQLVLTNFWTNQWVYSTPYYVTNSTNSAIIYTLSQLNTNFTTNSLIYTNWISGPVQLAALSSTVCTGYVNVATLADPSLQGRYFDFSGETLDFSGANLIGISGGGTNSGSGTQGPPGMNGTDGINGTNGVSVTAVWSISGSSIYPSGSIGTNNGWASDGSSIYPQ